MKNNIKIIPLGGVRENGKNLYAVEINDGIYVLDCGLKYPENEMLGIDVVIPDFSYLRQNKEKIVGVFLSHGHADAIGALPYFLNEFDVPVFGSKFTIELAKFFVKQSNNAKKFDNFNVINEKSEIIFDDVTVTFFKTTHSVPDSMGIVLSTKQGEIVYTGDFKFDQTVKEEYATNYSALTEVGNKGVLALLSDSGNADDPYPTVSELKIERYIYDLFQYHDSRIIIASNSANILRIQQVVNAAYKVGRKIFLDGKELSKILDLAIKSKKLILPSDDIFVSPKELKQIDYDKLVILETDKMGEPVKTIQRMANHQAKYINIEKGDLVLIATTPSHAMETTIAKTRDMVYRADAEVKMISDDLNASSDASVDDLQLMLNLLKPSYLIPVQGEYRMLDAHAKLAQEVGIPAENIFMLNKGDVLSYDGEDMHLGDSVDAGNTMIDGIGVGDIGNIVLRDRKLLSDDGIFIVVVTINRRKKTIIAKPKITSRGFVYVKSNKELMNKASEIVSNAIQLNLDNKEFDWGHLKQDVREKISHFLFDKTHRRPVILPVIMEVNQHRRKKHVNSNKVNNEKK
ncbi:ribonuclease J [Apilactobacillus xinyiensis]|uniref:Ribonuclease J n=1 Tax=Apilactobacillus xinyiensis TaxID=2841032 RepID=A0ABT0I1X1_9LACO|nr:ribonuclease J [Apilactobacillus xinyiensis]MCK8624712.1 ribonuclease J [Apilactobacillus xinyiensis]MCL0318827.1 ribonuclease J [Apilactobacillus xinyiensis]